MKTSVIELAETVKNALELEGIHVHVDDQYTTGSIYLDLDHGALGFIRVSDHKGKGNGYLFEIGSHIDFRHQVDKRIEGQVYLVEKFPASAVDELVEALLIRRMKLMSRTGVMEYKEQVSRDGQKYEHPVYLESRGRKSRSRISY